MEINNSLNENKSKLDFYNSWMLQGMLQQYLGANASTIFWSGWSTGSDAATEICG